MDQEKLDFTPLQGQYLSFIYNFTKINGIPPAESDLQKYFKVTAPTVHQMVLKGMTGFQCTGDKLCATGKPYLSILAQKASQ